MKMIKDPAPNFYEATCYKCGCTYMYQFEDLEQEQIDLPEMENSDDEYMSMFQKMFKETLYKGQPPERVYTTCPNCQQKIQHVSAGNFSTGFAR